MAAPAKFATIFGMTGKLEGTYNGGGALSTATDGILLDEKPTLPAFGYANAGDRPPNPASLDTQRGVAPSGRTLTMPLKPTAKGLSGPYSATGFPNVHMLMRAAGFDGAVTVTGGLEKWVYSPSAPPVTNFASMVANLYLRGELLPVQGILADLTSYSFNAGEVPIYEFTISGLVGAVTDVALPSISYPNQGSDPPKAISVQFLLGNFTAGVIRKLVLKFGRKIGARLDANVGGHAGFAPGRRTPTIEVTYETPALTTTPFTTSTAIDPYNLYDTAAVVPCSWQVGGQQYNRHKWSAPTVQVTSAPVPSEDAEGVALTTVMLQVNPSAIQTTDSLTNTWD